ncbi:MAG: glycosyltransferase family 4 protein [Bryobacteraceae bacterium]|nr:glycosyltransferase family 1 protein [Bryobacterales bacterium]NUN02054.1 glycosyltransferase family 4 protein [Bryobacteraceae bacterium]
MRFSVDAHAMGRHLTGNEVYIRNLLKGFARFGAGAEFIAYVSMKDAAREIPVPIRTRQVSNNPFVRLGVDLSRKLREDHPALVHVQYTAPLRCPAPIIVSVHDVSFVEHPEFFTRTRALQLRLTVRRTVCSAARVLTPSDFSRREIARCYAITPEKIEVIPNAVSSSFRPISRRNAAEWVRQRFGIQTPYILTVGDLQPRKNHAGLIRAYEQLVRNHPEIQHSLVLVGKQTWHAPQVLEAARRSGLANRIVFTGWVNDEELLQIYGGCDLFVFPSFYEGFGLPILEAMACGRAVACSGTSAMPEVADSAAILFDPRSAEEMVRAMRDVLLDAGLRGRLERLGLQRASLFSWDRAACQTLDVYYDVAGQSMREHAGRAKSVPVTIHD